jgi:predicted DNA binding CopG/RHH family protein
MSWVDREENTNTMGKTPKQFESPPVARSVEREATRAISIRLAVADIERAKALAKAKGIGYQTLIRMLVRESLERASRTRPVA